MTLPDGRSGKITVTVEAKTCNEGGLLQTFERTIITETDGNQRLSREIWTLTPVGG